MRRKPEMSSETLIRRATAKDAERIAEIYGYYVENTAVTFEFEAPDAAEIKRRLDEIEKTHAFFVSVTGGKGSGFSYASPLRKRPAYDASCEVTIYIDPEMRRKGLGRMLYTALQGFLEAKGITNLYACIGYNDEEDEYLNHDSPNFHKRMGFEAAGRFTGCGRKFDRSYDVVWMEKII